MSLQKNQVIPLIIENLSSDGNGVGHYEGQAIFVPGTAPGDILEVLITKALKNYAFGRIQRVKNGGPGRIVPDCPVAKQCGGCSLRHITYGAECLAKTGFVRDAFARIGGIDFPVTDVLPAPQPDRYRNKVQLPVGLDEKGRIVTGFYADRSHRVIPCPDCRLQPAWMNELAARACKLFEQYGVKPYNEETRKGTVRHLYMRQGWHSGQRLLCFVVNGNGLPQETAICEALQTEFSLTTILINRNTENTNVILGKKTRVVYGTGLIEDTLAGVPISMGIHEFYQINTPAAESLYAKARKFAALRPDDFLLDLYCGMGTIGLSMLPDCRRLVGVEVVTEAIEGAKATAEHLGLSAEKADFYCMDAGEAATRFAAEGSKPDVIVVDPPRKGCDATTLKALIEMGPRAIVMVSCNAATAARDVKLLTESGYQVKELQPVDLFPRTKHVETIILMTKTK